MFIAPGPTAALQYARTILASEQAADAYAFQITCSCGWGGYALRPHLEMVVERHFRTWVGGPERLTAIQAINSPLRDFHGIHQGQRCFIFGAGPSINAIPHALLTRLQGEITWGVNFVAQCLDPWLVPTYYAAAEAQELHLIMPVADWYGDRIKARFYAHASPVVEADQYLVDNGPPWYWVPRDNDARLANGQFAGLQGPDFGWAANGNTVVLDVCVQVAAYMGCDPIYLLGVDGLAYDHCHPEVHEDWGKDDGANTPGELIREHVLGAAQTLERHGVRLVNLTDGGMDYGIGVGRLADVVGGTLGEEGAAT